MTLALFDLDNTLIAGDSDHSFGEFLADEGLVDGDAHREQNDRFYQDYCDGQLDIAAYLRFALSPLKGKTVGELRCWQEQFMKSRVEPLLLQKAFDLIEDHRLQGHRLVIITATNRFVTEPIAKKLGIDDLLAAEPEIVDGHYTGDFTGIPTFAEGKVQRMHQWLEEKKETLEGSYFYSDSHNDLPLLEAVAHPVAVDADAKLTEEAIRRGWLRISLRQ